MKKINTAFKESLPHYNNLLAKKDTKFDNGEITSILAKYNSWFSELVDILIAKSINNEDSTKQISQKFNEYFEYLYTENKRLKLSSQGKFESSFIEDFANIILAWVVDNTLEDEKAKSIKIGSSNAFLGFNFGEANIGDYLDGKYEIYTKDQDASIFKEFELKVNGHTKNVNIPYIAVECKTYIDKTMIESSISTASKIKGNATNSKYYILACRNAIAENYNHDHHKIDGIFIFGDIKKNSDNKQGKIKIDETVLKAFIDTIHDNLQDKEKLSINISGIYKK